MANIYVKKVVINCDLRSIHKPRLRFSSGLGRGTAVLCLNRACNKARIVDSNGDIHNFYAPDKTVFSVDEIKTRLKNFGTLMVQISSDNTNKFRSAAAKAADKSRNQQRQRRAA